MPASQAGRRRFDSGRPFQTNRGVTRPRGSTMAGVGLNSAQRRGGAKPMGKVDGTPFDDMEAAWKAYVRAAPQPEVLRRSVVEDEAHRAIKQARRGQDHITAVAVWVRVPRC